MPEQDTLECHALHLAHSNREAGIINDIRLQAQARGIDVQWHSREQLARISKNGKQDQGVALDIICPGFRTLQDYLDSLAGHNPQRLLALDGISNPQNLGMIIRSATAGHIDGILWARKGNAALGPLVIKASAGTLYRAPLLLCPSLGEALRTCQAAGAEICILAGNASESLFEYQPRSHCIYVLGNETEGVSPAIGELADRTLAIPMNNGVESLNVAVTASLIAYAGRLGG
jgi:23S rRNA (guanosine2251-2'-O)-methyltransferase